MNPAGCRLIDPTPMPEPGPAHEVAVGVEQHLVGVDVGVVVRHLHGVGVEVVEPRHERADDEAGAGERLVHRRRLVEAPDDRLEVVDAQRPRVHVAVPADDVEGMVAVDVTGEPGAGAHEHLDVLTVDEQRAVRAAQVALGERRAVGELAGRREVLGRDVDVAARRQHEQLDSPGRRSDDPAVGHAGRHDDVVAGATGRLPNTLSSVALPDCT